MKNKSYQELETIFQTVQTLRSVASLLRWDSEVVMPKKSHMLRATQLATLNTLTQELIVSDSVAQHLKRAQNEDELDPWQKANVELMIRQYERQGALPKTLIVKIDNAIRIAENAWREARKQKDYSLFQEPFGTLVQLVQEKAQRLGDKLGLAPFEALMDEYDPGIRQKEVDDLLAPVIPLFPRIIQKQENRNPHISLSGRYSKRKQLALCRELLRKLHFPMDQGRLDESIHPFTEGIAGDIRITTIVNRKNPLQTLLGLMHELGHALYDNSLPKEYRFQLVGQDVSMVLHEGMALFWEKIIGGSHAFTHWLASYLQRHLDSMQWSAENIYRHLTQVNPTKVRIESDEICYMAHIILRYDVEKALFSQEITVKDVPALWQDKSMSLLGVAPKSPDVGCLQDIHWAQGYFGYFQTYALGFFFATQLFQHLKRNHRSLFTSIPEGNLTPLLNWLTENLFVYGARYNTKETILRLTQTPLHSQSYIDYLNEKYFHRG